MIVEKEKANRFTLTGPIIRYDGSCKDMQKRRKGVIQTEEELENLRMA